MIEEIKIGEKLALTEKIEDKDLLLFLGLTNDANPLYVQHDYASQTPFEKPIVPSIMLTGIITSAVSKYLPGPGSHILKQEISFPKHVYHYATIEFLLEVTKVDLSTQSVEITINATDDNGDHVVEGTITVSPPKKLVQLDGKILENF